MRKIIPLIILSIVGCGGCEDEKPLQKVEIAPKAKKLEVRIDRLDNDLFAADFSNPKTACQQLYQKYGGFFCQFVESDLMLAPCQSDSLPALLVPFVTNADIKESHNAVIKLFTDEKISAFDNQLTESFRRWNHFFPDSLVPRIVYYQSAWNSNISVSDSTLGISLDCYLGKDHPITSKLPNEMFPAYKRAKMDEKFLVSDALKGWVAFKSRLYYKQKDLLSELVFYGKLMYIAEALAPDISDADMLNWSDAQLQWAQKSEWNLWKTVANEKVIYQSKPFEVNKWFIDGPFTGATGVPQESPPQLGVWLGWNMVRQYMTANPNITLQDLLKEGDNLKIMQAYRPKK